MNDISVIGLDIAKHVFHVVGLSKQGHQVLKKTLRRSQLSKFFANLPACTIGIEGCATAHYWARKLSQAGHQVKLLPAQYVKAYVRGNKNVFRVNYLVRSYAKIQRPMLMSMGMIRGMMGGNGAMFTINGRSMDMEHINFSVERDVPEIWEVSNDSSMIHPFHVHNVQFQVLDRNGGAVDAHETGLKDTILVNPGEKMRILLVFRDYTDEKVPYMYHCHNLEHEDQGMMGQFTVV